MHTIYDTPTVDFDFVIRQYQLETLCVHNFHDRSKWNLRARNYVSKIFLNEQPCHIVSVIILDALVGWDWPSPNYFEKTWWKK